MKALAVMMAIASLSSGSLFGVLYNFGGSDMQIGNTATYTSNGISITASGYSYNPSQPGNAGTLVNMYQKGDGGDEVGLGIASDSQHEINHAQFIQLNLTNLIAAGVTSVSMGIGSVQAGENWDVFQSNIAGKIGSVIASGATDYPNLFTVALNAADPYISVTEHFSGNVLLSVLQTPELATYLGLASLLGVVGLIARRRRVAEKVRGL